MKTVEVFLVLFCLILFSCGEVKSSKENSIIEGDSLVLKTNSTNRLDTNRLFELSNYLKIDKIHTGPVYWNNKNSQNLFYRIIEIYEEEHLLLFVENITIGEEGGNYNLIKRYRLDEKKLSMKRFSLSSIDSLNFEDSVTIIGLFNNTRYKINLDNQDIKILPH